MENVRVEVGVQMGVDIWVRAIGKSRGELKLAFIYEFQIHVLSLLMFLNTTGIMHLHHYCGDQGLFSGTFTEVARRLWLVLGWVTTREDHRHNMNQTKSSLLLLPPSNALLLLLFGISLIASSSFLLVFLCSVVLFCLHRFDNKLPIVSDFVRSVRQYCIKLIFTSGSFPILNHMLCFAISKKDIPVVDRFMLLYGVSLADSNMLATMHL